MDISSLNKQLDLPLDGRIISCNTSQKGQKLLLRIAIPLNNTDSESIKKTITEQLKKLGYKSLIHFHSCSKDCDIQTVNTVISTVPNPNAVQEIKNHPAKGLIFSYQNLYHFKEADALVLKELNEKIDGEIIIKEKTTGEIIDTKQYIKHLQDNRKFDRSSKTAHSMIMAVLKSVNINQGRNREELIIQYPIDSQFDLNTLRSQILDKTGIKTVFEPVEPSFITNKRQINRKPQKKGKARTNETFYAYFKDILAIEKINVNNKSKKIEFVIWTKKQIDLRVVRQDIRAYLSKQNYANYAIKIIIKGNLPEPEYVADTKQLEHAVDQIIKYDEVSVDLEADGRFSYVEKLCLVQLATVDKSYIVDVLTIDDTSILKRVFENRRIQKIFHDGRWDIELIKRDLHMCVFNVFDTSAAYRVIGNAQHTSLDKLVDKYFNISLDKKLQKANWGKRPLTDEMMIYAQLDVHYLIQLREKLKVEISSMDREYLLEDYGNYLETVTPSEAVFNPNSFWRVKGMNKLTPQQQAVLKEVYLWRENAAKARNKPPYMIIGNDLMVEISKVSPTTEEKLLNIYNVRDYLVSRYGKKIISRVKKGLNSDPPVFPEDSITKRYPQVKNDSQKSLRLSKISFVKISEWRRNTALKLKTDPELVIPKDSVAMLASMLEKGNLNPIPGFGKEKIKRYSKELIRLIRKSPRSN